MLPNRLGWNAQSVSPKTRNAPSGSKLVMRSSPLAVAGSRNARQSDERHRSGKQPNWLRRKRPKPPPARPNAKTERKLRRNGGPNRPKGNSRKPPNGRQSSPPAERAGKRRSGKGIRDLPDEAHGIAARIWS